MDLADCWPLARGDHVRERLVAAYADPARGYHDLRHLEEVCGRIEELTISGGVSCDRVEVLLAAWFHDAVYDGDAAAEDRSAAWAEHELPQLGLGDETVAEVARLIRLTETHRPADDDANGCVLTDADLAILASSPERYAEYAADVRREYSHVPDEVFRTGRAAILGDLLAKPHLFHTGWARTHWEATARANVEAELARLTGQP